MRLRFSPLLAAAALAPATNAHAADLAIAEPVENVKICEAFGNGFFYSPGSDTCIKIGGYVEFGTAFGDTDFGHYNSTYPGSNWSNFFTEISIQLTASSVTEYGNLKGFIDFRAQTGNMGSFSESATQIVNSETNSGYVDTAWLSLGPLKAGYDTSLFDFGRGYTDTGGFGPDTISDHIQLTYAEAGWAFAGSIEDQRDRGGAGDISGLLEENGLYATGGQDNIPDIVGAVSYASGLFSGKLAAAYVNNAVSITGRGSEQDPFIGSPRTGWAIGGSAELALDMIAKGDKLFFTAVYGDNANAYTGIAGGTSVANTGGLFNNEIASLASGTSASAMASYKHLWTPSLWSAITASYADYDGAQNFDGYRLDAWRGVFSTSWTPVNGLELMLDGNYSHISDNGEDGSAWAVNLWMKRHWE